MARRSYKYGRANPDSSDLARDMTVEAVRSAGKRSAAKGAVEVAAKMSGKTIPYVGEALIAYEGGRSAVRDIKGLRKKGKEARKEASAAWKRRDRRAALEAVSRYGQYATQESFMMGLRTGVAGLTTAEVAERFVPRANPDRTSPPPGFEVNFYDGDWVIFDVARDWTVGELFEDKETAVKEAWRIFELEQKSLARRDKIRSLPGAKHGRSSRGMVSLSRSFKAKKAKKNFGKTKFKPNDAIAFIREDDYSDNLYGTVLKVNVISKNYITYDVNLTSADVDYGPFPMRVDGVEEYRLRKVGPNNDDGHF